jgi:hypothetical protein
MIVRWVVALAPTDFGFARSRWTCEAVAIVLREDHGVRASRETVRRRLRESDLVWRRPRPVVRRRDPERAAKLAALRKLLHGLPADETAVIMDEVEVHTNPKVGSMWMRRGDQATIATPGVEPEELVHDAFLAVLEALPRFHSVNKGAVSQGAMLMALRKIL